MILAPCKYPVPSGNGPAAASPDGKDATEVGSGSAVEVAAPAGERPKTELRGFRPAYVFDVSQTDGEPIEDLDAVRPKLLEGEAPEGLWDALVKQTNDAGFEVVRRRRGSENGYCDFGSRQTGIRPDVDDLQAVKTLVHELGHALLHRDRLGLSRDIAEVEVESVAFVVLDALGLASDDYSFPYVARWASGDVSAVKATAQHVIKWSRRIIGGLGEPIADDSSVAWDTPTQATTPHDHPTREPRHTLIPRNPDQKSSDGERLRSLGKRPILRRRTSQVPPRLQRPPVVDAGLPQEKGAPEAKREA